MKAPSRTFTVEVGESALIGVAPGATLGIALTGDGKIYRAPIEKVHAALARWHQKANPAGQRRRRFLTSSEQLKRLANDDDSRP